MAYMNQEKKRKINEALKKVVPKDWKYSLRVRHHSAIVMTIYSAPVDLLRAFAENQHYKHDEAKYKDVNNYHYHNQIEDQSLVAIFDGIFSALNTDNFDNSDPMTDYFHVGHYVDLRIGAWDKAFICTAKKEALA